MTELRIKIDDKLAEKLKEFKGDRTWEDAIKALLYLHDPEEFYLNQINDMIAILRQRLIVKGTNEAWRVLMLSQIQKILQATLKDDRRTVHLILLETEKIVEK